ncbi:MAG: hypothetical protein GY765_35810 [bacterium]|nr:hypothetical protein [bacterium]
MRKQLILIALLLMWAGKTHLNAAETQDHAGVLKTLKRLHDGYQKRDVSEIGTVPFAVALNFQVGKMYRGGNI